MYAPRKFGSDLRFFLVWDWSWQHLAASRASVQKRIFEGPIDSGGGGETRVRMLRKRSAEDFPKFLSHTWI